MTLSLGGAILQPERLEEFEKDSNRYKLASKRSAPIIDRGSESSNNAQETIYMDLDEIVEKILERLRKHQSQSQRLTTKLDSWLALILLIVLSVGAQIAMIVAEQRGVIPWRMHLWYTLGKKLSP